MDISLINSQSLLHLLSLTEKKEELLQILEQIDAEIIRTLKGGVVFENITSQPAIARPAPAAKSVALVPSKTVKPAKAKKRTMSPEGRARISAATKARWAALRAGNGITAKAVVVPKAGKPAKEKKKGISPEGRAKIAAAATARWAAVRAAKAAGKPTAPTKAAKPANARENAKV